MDKNKLRERLKKSGCAIFIFFLGYLIVGFFLNSKYPITQYEFNLSKAYEVLRDALTLTAYFLAPLVAYNLFTDWRIQHYQVKIEKDVHDLYAKAVSLDLKYKVLIRYVDKKCINQADLNKARILLDDVADLSKELLRMKSVFEEQPEYKTQSARDFIFKIDDICKEWRCICNAIKELLGGFKPAGDNEMEFTQKHQHANSLICEDLYDVQDVIDENIIFLTSYKAKVKVLNYK